jgi:Na+/melibiose symporter-like transporter
MLTKLRLFVKERRMEITITVCVALGTLFLGWFFTLNGKTNSSSLSWAILSIGLVFYLIALFCCFKIIRQEAMREKREIERHKVEMEAFRRFIQMSSSESSGYMVAAEREAQIEEQKRKEKRDAAS